MKQKKQNRILAALLAVAMMFQMLPMMAFAAEDIHLENGQAKIGDTVYNSVMEAVKAAGSDATIELGEGNYTLYNVDGTGTNGGTTTGTTKGKNLTFVGQGTDKTVWHIGEDVADPNKTGEYNGDYSFDGAGTVTFENMTLRSGTTTDPNTKLGFIRPNKTVVDKCEIVGWTAYWGDNSAEFTNTTFKPSLFKDAIWVYSSKEATFDNCTFTAGRGVKVYTEKDKSVTVNFNNCTVENSPSHPAIYIDELVLDNESSSNRYTINITGSNNVNAATYKMTCSKLFGFRNIPQIKHPGHFTNVKIDGELVWREGEMLTHDYTDGEKDNAYNITYSSSNPNGWVEEDGHYKRHVIKTCKYCGYNEEKDENGYKLAYELNGGTAAAGADYTEKIVAENKTVTLAAAPAPAQEGVYFLGWEDGNGKQYNADATITLTANTTLTAQWGDVPPVEPAGGGSGDGGAGAVVAGALLGGAGYLLGTRLWLESTFGFVPANRIELAMALWKRADCPAPVSTELYPDIDEDDTDAQAAARWCVEQDLMKDFARTNSDGTQTVKFKPYGYVFRPQSLVKWYKLEKLLNEQQSTNA
ncbi:right-handed parallel beta-helix repeat-containing protein [Faecalibacterium sp. 7]|uniref:right-handed parallel beta-helix repeat-containing protein n=1 Tax=Faecalibacterium sp. 7 TaxID=3402017 RepID=UPI003C2EE333